MDSVTRLAQAQRQIGLSAGEPPATKGYTPSVFSLMSRLLERAGSLQKGGSITGIYTILVEGDDMTEPIADAARGILDGHIALSRRLASKGHYPAIDVLDSISRVADHVCDDAHIAARRQVLRLLAAYRESEELINIGAYVSGSNAETDVAHEMRREFDAFLQQSTGEGAEYPWTCRRLIELAVDSKNRVEARRGGRGKGKVA
jgi:flagellum-specific ATP synthase